jgi:hypothetical protein
MMKSIERSWVMMEWSEEFEEYNEIPEEYLEEEITEEIPNELSIDAPDASEIPDVGWADEIGRIEDPEIREKEIEVAEKLLEKEKNWDKKLDSGEITEYQHWEGYEFGIRKEKVNASTRCSFESVGLSYDHFADLGEQYDMILAEAAGNPKPAEMKEGVKELINQEGPEFAQESADKMLEKEEEGISEDTHESISRQVRLYDK